MNGDGGHHEKLYKIQLNIKILLIIIMIAIGKQPV
jgi:hypothetical protein